MMKRRILFTAALLCVATQLGVAQAAEATPTYAAISLIGDKMGLIGFQPQLGSRLNQNRRGSATIADAGFDATALRTIQETMKGIDGKANVLLYAITSARLSDNPSLLFNGDKAVIPPAFDEGMKKDGANARIAWGPPGTISGS